MATPRISLLAKRFDQQGRTQYLARHKRRNRNLGELPRITGRDVVKALKNFGYEFDRQRGSHIVLRHTSKPHRRVTVPDHREVSKGTLRAIIREVGLTVDEFKNLL